MRNIVLGSLVSAAFLMNFATGCDGGTGGTGGDGGSGGSAPTCGNGKVEGDEQCDDGDANSDTGACKTDCTPASCGDGFVGPGEECDPSAASSDTESCTPSCKNAVCGDGLILSGVEECDDGPDNSDTGACKSDCTSAKCGDGQVQTGVEECDEAGQNSDTGACTLSCKTNVCGDGLVLIGTEECDDGAQNSDTGACTTMCVNAACGDGLVQTGVEGCDDGNMVDGDGCTNMCTLPTCGDGVEQMGEECDLGMNNSNTGACTVLCKDAECGDGFTQAGVEQCDLGAGNNNSGMCTLACTSAACGDGFVQTGVEECDLGNQNSNTGGCTVMCKTAKCGDGFVQSGIEACDDGNMTNADGCNKDCIQSGTAVWTQTYSGVQSGGAIWIGAVTDAMGNTYVTGGELVTGQGVNLVVRKYSPTGAVLWTQTANGTANGDDYGQSIALDGSGNVIVIGYVANTGTGLDIFIRKYSGTNGAVQWTQQYNGPLNLNDEGYGIAVNQVGDLYVTGGVQNVSGQGYNIWYGKLAGINGTIVYQNAVNGAANQDDAGLSVAADKNNNFVVTGLARASAGNPDVWTTLFKDNGNSSTITWTRTYNGAGNGEDSGNGVTFDAAGNVIVAGGETVSGQGANGWLRKYDMAGNTVWTQTYNATANLNDSFGALAVDVDGNIVVAGWESLANMKTDILVRKYNAMGSVLWTKTHNGSLDDNDQGLAVGVDMNANAYVAGYEIIAGSITQAWLRKYTP